MGGKTRPTACDGNDYVLGLSDALVASLHRGQILVHIESMLMH